MFVTNFAKADHYFGGYYYYEQIPNKKIKITLVTYTDVHKESSDRDSVLFNWGDAELSYLKRNNNSGEGEEIYHGVLKNVYTGTHEYALFANYQSFFSDNFRLFDVRNFGVGKSGGTNLRFDALISVQDSSDYCQNNSPKPLIDPYFFAVEGESFHLNFGYYDLDGDSMEFKLTECKQANGSPASGYTTPEGVSINSETGQFNWNSPTKGKYCFSMEINEYRNEELIGTSSTDFTVFVNQSEFVPIPRGSGFVNSSSDVKHNFTGSTTETFTFLYNHPGADSVAFDLRANYFNIPGLSVVEKGVKSATEIKDTIDVSYTASGKFNGSQLILWECTAYLGKDSTVKDVYSIELTSSDYKTWSCITSDLENVHEIAPQIPSRSIAPNLFSDNVWINVGSNFEAMIILVFDLRGRLVKSYFNLTAGTVKLDLQQLSAALYIVQLLENNEVIHVEKIVKR